VTVVALAGCRPQPLGAYLKALGLFRLVATQVDPGARGWWDGDVFRLDSSLDADGLAGFLLGAYRPTPVLSPWNKDAGFKEAGSTATDRLRAMEASTDERYEPYRRAIAAVRRLRDDPRWDQREKVEQVTILRNVLPDEAIDWIDAAIVLRGADKPAFPALLGAGGNFGRLELSPTFIAAVLQVHDPAPKAAAKSRAWLGAALFDEGAPVLTSGPIGQFDPGAAGGLRADGVGLGKPLTNPWDLLLVIEGSLVWAAGVSRRASGSTSLASIPFTVAPSAAGHASVTAGERGKARAELWAPLWSAPLGLPELRRLFAEGRLSWASQQARSGVDAVRAIRSLGVDSGVDSFVRHLVADRMGQSPLAVPVGRYEVRQAPEVGALASVDRWVDQLARAAASSGAPASLVRAANRVERAMFAAASGGPESRQDLLVALAEADAVAGRTERARTDGALRPAPWLSPAEWLPAIDDGTPEVRLAAAIAVAHDGAVADPRREVARTALRPVVAVRRRKERYGDVAWRRDEALVVGLGARPIADVLADLLVVRSEAERAARADAEVAEACQPWFAWSIGARTGDAEARGAGQRGLARLGDLVAGLLLLAPRREPDRYRWPKASRVPAVVPAWRVLAPFYARHPLRSARARPHPRAGWARQLVAGNVDDVIAEALLRWQQVGLGPIYGRRSVEALSAGVDGRLLAAALMCGATVGDVEDAARAVAPQHEEPEPEALEGAPQ